MKRFPHTFFSIFLAALLILSLSACADGGGEAETGEIGADTAMADQPGGMQQDTTQQDGMGGQSVSLQGTNQLLQQGITQISTQQAVRTINSWEKRLDDLEAEGQAAEAISSISETLGEVETLLQGVLEGAGQPDAEKVGQAFQQLSTQLQTLLQNAQGLNLQSQQEQVLSQMQQGFQKAAQQLTGGGGM